MMKSSILYTAAGVGGVLLLGIGFLIGHATQEKPEVLPEAEPLFQTELARQGAEYLTDLGVQRMQTQSDMNLCTITAAVLREAELFGVFRSYLASLPETERPAAIRQQIEWQKKYREDVNDHQVEFAKNVAERMGTIIHITEIGELRHAIEQYDQIVAGMNQTMESNNACFCSALKSLIDEICC